MRQVEIKNLDLPFAGFTTALSVGLPRIVGNVVTNEHRRRHQRHGGHSLVSQQHSHFL
jgi:hypothetical protein